MDKYQIMITPKAKGDLIDIGDYISFILLEPKTAKNFVKGLRRSISRLQYFPRKFPIVQDYISKKFTICHIRITLFLSNG